MSTFVIRVNETLRHNFERAMQARLWDTTRDMVQNPIQPGDRVYFWITGGGRDGGFVGRARATSGLWRLTGGESRPWVDEDDVHYTHRVDLDDFERVTHTGFRWSEMPDAPKGQNPIVRLPEETARWVEHTLTGFIVAEVSEEVQRLADSWATAPDGLPPSEMEKDLRRRVEASITVRQGQGKFRADLLHAYGRRCAITGTDIEVLLDAAHIMPYRGEHTNHPSNGILMRTDLHTLLDKHLLAIVDGKVALAPQLDGTPYETLRGAEVYLPTGPAHPKEEYLAAHRSACDWL